MATHPFQLPVGTPRQLRWLHGIVAAVLVMNGIDAVLTLLWVGLGLAREANPLLADLVREHPVAFVTAKCALVGLASLLLWRRRERPLAVVAIFVAFLAYYAVLAHHLGFVGLVLGELWRTW